MKNLTSRVGKYLQTLRPIFGGNLEASILSPSKDAGLHRFSAGAAPFDKLRVLSSRQKRTHPLQTLQRRRLALASRPAGLALLLACVALGLGSLVVSAHAGYARSEPAAGAVIPQAPDEVHVWFTQELFRRAGANTLEVVGPDGARVDKQDARIDDDDRTHMIVSLQADLPAGAYTVRWGSLSAEDGDADSGEFGFVVDPAAVRTTPPAGPTASRPETSGSPQPAVGATPPAAVPTPAPSPQERGGLPCLGSLLSAAALVTFSLGQRQSRRAGRGRGAR
jgi:methionine-rich copper-binding protein CopC